MPIKSLSQSSLLNFEKYSSMLAGNDPFSPSAYDLLETTILTSDSAQVSFTNLDTYTDYKHLQLRIVSRSTSSGTSFDDYLVRLNDSGTTSFRNHELLGNGSSVSSTNFTESGFNLIGRPAGNSTASAFGASVIDILDFSSATKNTTLRALEGFAVSSISRIRLASALFNNTAAVTSIQINRLAQNFAIGSRFSIYGVK